MLLSTAMVAAFAVPGVAHAQLVNSGDLVSAVDSGGNGGQLTVVDTSATQTDMTVLSRVVVANWNRFNVTTGTTVNVLNGTVDPTATLVNRVIGANFSDISGTINAQNVNLWLINQNGIVFGDGAAVNSASFFASTIDVANQDVFDFYEGTMGFGGPSNRLNFSGSLGNGITTASPNVTFVTDGSLMFVSEQLNLDANFDAGSGRVSFVTAADVDVTFTPGSPLTYVVNAGTTVAQGQTIAGAIEGAGVDFAMFTAAGVVNAVLQVDATVTANAAAVTDNGVRLFAEQAGAGTVTVELSEAMTGTGAVDLRTDGNFSTAAGITGSSIDFVAGGSANFADLIATAGAIDLDVFGGNLVAGDVQATGRIFFTAPGTAEASFASLVSTGGMVAVSGAIPGTVSVAGLTQGTVVDLFGINALNLGDVTATSGGVSLSSINGSITADDISSAGNASLVAGNQIAAGDVLASTGTITLNAVNGITTTSVRATTGAINIDGGSALDLGTLEAGGNIALDTFDGITTAAVTAGGALTVGGAVVPSAVTFTGNASAQSITIDTPGLVSTADLTATAGSIAVNANALSGGLLSATDDVVFRGAGSFVAAGVTADSDGDDAGDALIGQGPMGSSPLEITISGTTSGAAAFLRANVVNVGNVTATAGDATLSAVSIDAGAVSATGGDVNIDAISNVTVGSVLSTAAGMVGGNASLRSNAGGNVGVGSIAADGTVALDTTGGLTTGAITAGGALTVGGTSVPNAVTFGGNASAASITVDTSGAFLAQGVTATAGGVDVDAASITAGAVSATGGDVILLASGGITTTSIGASGAIDVDSTGGGTLDLGAVTGSGAANLDTTGTLTLGTVNVGGALVIGALNDPATLNLNGNITAGSFAYTTLNPFVSQNITTTNGDLNIDAASIATGALAAQNGGGVILTATGNITTASIASNEPGIVNGFIDVESTGGGTVNLGALSSDGNIDLDTSGLVTATTISSLGDLTIGGTATPTTVTFTGNVSANAIDIDATGLVTAQNIASTGGDLNILADAISAGAVTSTEGDVILSATNNITTASITSNQAFGSGGAIDVDSTGGGTLDLGALTGSGAANLDTTGTLTLGTVNVGGALVIGALNDPATLNLNGNITAGSFAYTTANPFVSQDITTTNGDLNIDAASIATGALSATGGDVNLVAVGNITTASIAATAAAMVGGAIDVDSTGGGALDLGALTATQGITLDTAGNLTTGAILAGGGLQVGDGTTGPNGITITGNVTAQSIALTSLTGIAAQDIEATGGSVSLLTGNNDDLIAGNVLATGDISFAGSSLGQAQFASLVSTGGNVGNTGSLPGTIVVTGQTRGLSVNLNSGFDITVADVTSTAGSVSVRSFLGNTVTGNVSATGGNATIGASILDNNSGASVTTGTITTVGGNVLLAAPGGVTTGAISATADGGLPQFIDARSTAGGNLDLASLTADGDITLNTTGQILAGTVAAGGNLVVGSIAEPSAVTFTGSVSASAITIDALGAFMAGDMTATNAIDVDVGGPITTGNLEADLITLLAVGGITTGNILANQSLALGTTGANLQVGDVTLGNIGASLSLSADGAGANVIAGDLRTNNGNILVTAANAITAGVVATSLMGSSTAGTIGLHAGQNITTDMLTAGEDLLVEAAGNFVAGAITVGDDAIIGAGGSVTTGNILATGLGSDANLVSFNGAAGASTFGFAAETLTGSNVAITADGALSSGTVTAQDNITLDAASIATQALAAVNGSVDLTALGAITTASVAAGDAIAAESTGGGVLNLGTLDAGAGVTLDTTGSLTTAAITADGSLLVGSTRAPSAVSFTGDVSALDIGIVAAGALTALDLVSTGGLIDVDAASINAIAIEANGGGVSLLATGGITTATITADDGITAESTGGGALDLGTLDAGLGVALDTTGSITTAGIMAGGALAVGQLRTPGAVTFTGNVAAGSITVDADLAFDALDLTTTGGAINVDALSINADTLTSVGGGVVLLAQDGVTTSAITSSGLIDVDSTNGGALDLGTLDAGAGIALDTAGSITAAEITAGGALQVGQTLAPDGVTFLDDVSAQSITIDTTGALEALNLASTNGAIDIGAASIAVDAISATGGNATLLATTFVTTDSITATGAIDVDSTNGGALNLGTLSAGGGIALDTLGTVTTGAITAGGALVVGAAREPGAVTFTGNVSGSSITVDAGGAFSGQNLTSTAGAIDIDAGTITALTLSATGGGATLQAVNGVQTSSITSSGAIDVDSTAGGALNLGPLGSGAGITLDTTGNIAVAAITAGGALVVGGTAEPGTVSFTGDTTAGSITVDVSGVFTGQNLATTGGIIDIDARTITANTVAATGGDVQLASVGDITTGAITATRAGGVGGAIDIDSTGTGEAAGTLNIAALLADLGISLDTQGAIMTGSLTARGGAIAANGRTIDSGAIAATGGDVLLQASGAITTGTVSASRAGGVGGAIDIDSTAGGTVRPGAMTATQGIAIDTAGSVITDAITAGGDLTIGTAVRTSTVTFNGAAQAANMSVDASGLVTTQALRASTGTIDIEAGDLALTAGPVEARNVILTSFDNGSVGLGSETGDFSLTDTELGLIQADSLLINAGTSRVGIAEVTFGANAGRDTVAIATTGEINITGNITGTAGTRTFRFGGTAAGTGRASRITSDINRANVNLGTNALELRGDAIVFGQTEFDEATRDLSIAELVRDFISNPNSILYDPRAAITNPVYLTAGNLSVTYGGSALFQNTSTRTAGNIFSGVVLAGGNSGLPTLALTPDAPGGGGSGPATNAFALFGSINGFDGSAAALLGQSVIGVDGDVLLDASRINGCVIGSGADCVTTIVGNVVMTVPREVISLLVAEDRLLVPFDPLVGTNNESLFSDAASASADEEECENRDANGVCVSN
ncbi:hypothetical protein IP79_06235 [Porphyrobacter sp. AAP60]|nr:hypothetical protein IP79_06235 [Porphyrobacter sp. AAP60]